MTFFADPPPACHGTNEPVLTVPVVCARYHHTPDRDDPGIGRCDGCDALLGSPSATHAQMATGDQFGTEIPLGFVARTWGAVR